MLDRQRTRTVAIAAIAFVVFAAASLIGAPMFTHRASSAGGTLILFDPAQPADPYGKLSEQNATFVANLVGRFGPHAAHSVNAYAAHEMDNYSAVIYVGAFYRDANTNALPAVFLDDVLSTAKPVMWIANNIWHLTNRFDALNSASGQTFASTHGFTWGSYVNGPFDKVAYKGRTVGRSVNNLGQLAGVTITDATKATTLAVASRADSSAPWAVRSASLTFITELPFAYMIENDRYLVFADLLFDLLAPETPTQHRAIVRLEDISPAADPQTLIDTADALAAEGIPFAFHIIPFYRDPDIAGSGENPITIRLRDRPDVVSALRYMISKGGIPIMHGVNHQWGTVANPYDGQTGNDFEFYRAHVDAVSNAVVLDGAVPNDSATWAGDLLDSGLAEIAAAGLPTPVLFTTPHYAASPVDYAEISSRFSARLERTLYFNGVLTGTTPDLTYPYGQFFPYPVRDVYGSVVLPENLGNETEAYNQHAARLPAEIIANAEANLVVRDGFASFFWHPYLAGGTDGTSHLTQIVDGIKALGYTFVDPTTLLDVPGGTTGTTTTTTSTTTTSTSTTTPATTSTTSTSTTSTSTTAPATTTSTTGPTTTTATNTTTTTAEPATTTTTTPTTTTTAATSTTTTTTTTVRPSSTTALSTSTTLKPSTTTTTTTTQAVATTTTTPTLGSSPSRPDPTTGPGAGVGVPGLVGGPLPPPRVEQLQPPKVTAVESPTTTTTGPTTVATTSTTTTNPGTNTDSGLNTRTRVLAAQLLITRVETVASSGAPERLALRKCLSVHAATTGCAPAGKSTGRKHTRTRKHKVLRNTRTHARR